MPMALKTSQVDDQFWFILEKVTNLFVWNDLLSSSLNRLECWKFVLSKDFRSYILLHLLRSGSALESSFGSLFPSQSQT